MSDIRLVAPTRAEVEADAAALVAQLGTQVRFRSARKGREEWLIYGSFVAATVTSKICPDCGSPVKPHACTNCGVVFETDK